jgi:hypothetical protein
LTIQLRVKNQGGLAADNVTTQTLLPTGWSLNNPTDFTVESQTVTSSFGRIPAGDSVVLTLSIRINGSGKLQSQIQTNSVSDVDSTPGNGYTNGEDDEAWLFIRTK